MDPPKRYLVDNDEYRIPDNKGGMLKCIVSNGEEFGYVTVYGAASWPSLALLERIASLFWDTAPVYIDLKDKRTRFKVLLFARKNEPSTTTA